MACDLVKIHSSIKNINPRGGSSIIEVNNNSIIMFGGADREQTAFQDMMIYQKGTNIFHSIKSTGDVPMPRSGHAVVNYGRYMILFGGIDFAEEAVFNDLYIFDTESMEWNYIGESGIEIIARNSHSLGIVKDFVNKRSYLVVYGGASPEHGPLGDTIYAEIPDDPSAIDIKSFFVKWELLEVLPNSSTTTNSTLFTNISHNTSPGPREMHGTCCFQGIMIISGGRNEHQLLSDVWILRVTNKNTNRDVLDLSIEDNKEVFHPLLVWELCDALKLPYALCTHGTSIINNIHITHSSDDKLSNNNYLDSIDVVNRNEKISLSNDDNYNDENVQIVNKLVIIGGFSDINGGMSDKIITITMPDNILNHNISNKTSIISNDDNSNIVDNIKQTCSNFITNNILDEQIETNNNRMNKFANRNNDNISSNENNHNISSNNSIEKDNSLSWETMKLNIPLEGRFGLSMCNLSMNILKDIVTNKKYNPVFNEQLKHKVQQYHNYVSCSNTTSTNNINNNRINIDQELYFGLLIFGGVSIEKDFGDLYLLINS